MFIIMNISEYIYIYILILFDELISSNFFNIDIKPAINKNKCK